MNLGLDQITASLERFSKLPKSYRMAVYPAILVLVVGLYVYLLYLPTQESLDQARSRQFELQRKLNEVRSVASNVAAFEEEIATLEKKLAIALRQLPDSKELPVLLTDVTSLGKNAGLEFKAFRPQEEVKRDFYAEVPIEIEFTGGYHEVATFFDRVAKLPRIINVASLEMKIQDESPSSTQLLVRGSATTFRFLDEQSRPAAEPEDEKKKGRHGRKARRPAGGKS